jgi:hypothetical protein
MTTLEELLRLQSGVVSRRQLVARGWADHQIARMVRSRRWARVHPGVFVDHTGELTWLQQAWAAVLFSWPAALAHQSALRAAEGPGRRGELELPVHVVVEKARHVSTPPGVRLHRDRHAYAAVQWNRSPPRVRYERAVIDVAAVAASELAAIGVLGRAVQSRRTTARRLLEALQARERTTRGVWMRGVLEDVAEGTCSALEHGYLTKVERPHGLPRARRQVVAVGRSGRIYRDVSYVHGLEVELDGRLDHDSAEGRDRDFDRDLLTQVQGGSTARLSWGQVFDRPCWTAAQVAALLHRLGWNGSPVPCGSSCCLRG